MTSPHYHWQRFWIPRGGSISLSNGGYLSGERSYLNPDLRTFTELMNLRCLVLLGEPGLGKSRTISSEYQKLVAQIEQVGEQFFPFNLNAYGSEELLVRRLFESREFGEWMNGSHYLHLFLDGLDECLLRIDTVAALLAEELRKCPTDRLLLRVACRSADWPPSLEDWLCELWGKDAVAFYELCPLRKEEVALAAQIEGLNADDFLAEVSRKEAVPFAAKPVTLDFLLRRYRKDGQLPNTQAALYEGGCRLLADESNQSYLDSRASRQLTADQRMLVAGRIAAVTVFSNKAAIWHAVDRGEVGEEDVKVREICGHTEILNEQSFAVTEAAIRETMGTGLFSLRDENRLGWAHQTYAEFLAAWYLKHHQFAPAEAMRLLILPHDASGKIVPQLHETAARLAGIMPEVFRQIMKNDPDVLLRSDVAATSAADREALVAALLELFRAEQACDDWFNRDHYRKLKHLNLVAQLRPIISSKDENFLVRRVAIDIAEECELREVQSELATLALDQSDFLPTRIQAACAISKIADRETRARLMPLVFGEAGNDPDNELLGYGLKALWPEHLTAEGILSVLVEPRESFLGAYYVFLHQDFLQHLRPADLPLALNWVAEQQHERQEMSSLKKLGDEILIKAWDYLDLPEILASFAHAAFVRLKAHYEMIDAHWRHDQTNPFADDDNKRRRVLRAMMVHIEDADKDWLWLVCSPLLSVQRQDVLWLLGIILTEQSEIVQEALSCVLARFFGHAEVEPEYLSAISDACQHNAILAANFTFYVELESLQAQQMKSNYEMLHEHEERLEARRAPPQPVENPLPPLLDHFDQGDLAAWWQLNFKLALRGGHEAESDLTALPGWQHVDEETHVRIIAAAKKYILDADPETSKWLGQNITYRPAHAGYRALRFLLTTDPAFVSALSIDIWRKWVPIIIAYPLFSNDIEKSGHVHRLLTKLAYQHAPESVVDTLLFQIQRRNEGDDIWLSFDRLEDCWDNRLLSVILEKVRDERIKSDLFRQLLQQLLELEHAEAEAFAKSLLTLPLAAEGQARERAAIAAQELLLNAQDAAWEILWPMFQQDIEFGRYVIEAIVDRPSERSVITRLNEQAAAELYIWLCQQYPHSEDPQEISGIVYSVTTRHSLAHWRDAIPNHLKEKGTVAACAALEQIVHALPHLEWLKFVLLDAQKNTRRKEWSPLSPEEILKMVNERQQQRLMQTNEAYNTEEIFQAIWILECEEASEQGTAFMLSGVGLVTCRHVLGSKTHAFRRGNLSEKYPIKVLAEDETLDLAVLSIDVPTSAELAARYSPELVQGEQIVVAGFPNYNWGDTGILFPGVVGGFRTHHSIRTPLINAPIVQGNSGGPVLDSKGLVVGVAVKGAKHKDEANSTEHVVIPIYALHHLKIEDLKSTPEIVAKEPKQITKG